MFMRGNLARKSDPLRTAPQEEEENPNGGKAAIPDHQPWELKEALPRQRSNLRQAGHSYHQSQKKNLTV